MNLPRIWNIRQGFVLFSALIVLTVIVCLVTNGGKYISQDTSPVPQLELETEARLSDTRLVFPADDTGQHSPDGAEISNHQKTLITPELIPQSLLHTSNTSDITNRHLDNDKLDTDVSNDYATETSNKQSNESESSLLYEIHVQDSKENTNVHERNSLLLQNQQFQEPQTGPLLNMTSEGQMKDILHNLPIPTSEEQMKETSHISAIPSSLNQTKEVSLVTTNTEVSNVTALSEINALQPELSNSLDDTKHETHAKFNYTKGVNLPQLVHRLQYESEYRPWGEHNPGHWLLTIDPTPDSSLGAPLSTSAPVFQEASYNFSRGFPMCYHPPPQADVTNQSGICFPVKHRRLRALGLPFTEFAEFNQETMQEFVFVTAISANHYNESLDCLGSLQKNMPGYTIVVYDLGLTTEQKEELESFCDVEIRPTDLGNRAKYSVHVVNLFSYAFKPLLILEALRWHKAVVWLDSSFRLYQPLTVLYPEILASGGLYLFMPPPKRTVVQHTHPNLYNFLPTNLSRLTFTRIHMPNGYYFRSEPLFKNVLWWWGLCALTRDCTLPCKRHPCDEINQRNMTLYAGCHRFDMSVINVLLANLHGYNYLRYGRKRVKSVLDIVRDGEGMFTVQRCQPP